MSSTTTSGGNECGKRPRNRITCYSYSENLFVDLVRRASCATADEWRPNPQTTYLASYITSLEAKGLIVEDHYIDRHFMEEVSLYYSKSLVPRRNWTTRIHVFSDVVDEARLDAAIRSAATGDIDSATTELQRSYCGYVVVRPLPSVPIGRTVLKHLEDKPERKFPTCQPYPVHFLGFQLTVHGLAFQQQDRAVAACATTAIWSALQRVSRREGARPPTSWEITEAAVRHYLPLGRPFPSSGLTMEQMCETLRAHGFAPDLFRAASSPYQFLLLLYVYLRSGIPVILTFNGPDSDEGHAVTVVGYAESDEDVMQYQLTKDQKVYTVALHNLACDRVFIHDDRLGPYARAGFNVESRKNASGKTYDQLQIKIDWPGEEVEVADVYVAAAPLYPKLRTNARELFETAAGLIPLISAKFASNNQELGLSLHFLRSGDYQASLYQANVDPARISIFQKQIALSRYIGIQRWYLNRKLLMETVWDTTDTMRETRYGEHLLGVVCLDQRKRQLVDAFANLFNVVSG